jgi:hypothetical protein
MDIADG